MMLSVFEDGTTFWATGRTGERVVGKAQQTILPLQTWVSETDLQFIVEKSCTSIVTRKM